MNFGPRSVRRSLETGFVPASPVVRILRKWEADYNRLTGFTEEKEARKGFCRGLDIEPARSILTRKMDLPYTTVEGHLKGHVKWMFFDLADAYLCAIDRVQAWYDDEELADAYQKVNLAFVDDPSNYVFGVRHGTWGAYTNHSCRCDRCKRAHADGMLPVMRRRRQGQLAVESS